MGGGGKGGGGYSAPSINYGQLANALNQVEVKPSPYETQIANMAQQYWNQTSPLRGYFIQDFTNFLRPPGATTTTTTTGGGQGATTTSTTGKIPSYSDIYSNLSQAFSPANYSAPNWDFNRNPTARDWLQNIGADPFAIINKENVPIDDTTAMNQYLKEKAQNLFNEQVVKNQAQQGTNTTSSTTQTSTTPAGFTNSNLYNPYNLPGYAPLYQLARTGLESQYNPARENILSSIPRGGALANSLASLEMGRAQQAGSLPATIAAPLIGDIMNKAYGAAFNSPQTAIAGMSAADQGLASRYGSSLGALSSMYGANSAAQMQAAALNQQAGMANAAGKGSLLGMGLKGGTSLATAPSSSILGSMMGL